MNTRDLAYFRALVEKKNYTVVAQQFSVSQPAVTQAIHRLEREFDVKLVLQDRSHQRTEITRAGQLLYKNAQAIQANISLAHREIDSAKQPAIRFGLPPIIGTMYFPNIAGELLNQGFLKQLAITETGSGELLTKLQAGDIDIALLGSYAPLDLPTIQAFPLGERPFSVIVSPKHRLAQQPTVAFKDLTHEKFIGLTGKFVHPGAFNAYCRFAGVQPEIIYNTPDIAWAKGLVKANLGISLLVRDIVNSDDGVVCLSISDPVPTSFHVSVAIRTGYVVTEREQQFIDELLTMPIQPN
ncbi:LysR family transcriptional regulator [Lactobacillus pentosus] [Lactiplantibacillus mudanjiangensis]|uniref:LysR family transcriptional regulator n=1 Tax=Lactiplantibacillus mudanjiangensis TaxID=1296538 RepID=UPI0010153396|nr:LysR family transcriptional regulator [Lactobacillus pentosus] [Lactiplantibacillus mudanjiangensis]